MIYIQTLEGLSQITPSLTKEKILAALGYTPADNATFYEDETGALLIADSAGYVIARIDNSGLETTKVSASAIELDGEDLATKLKTLAESVPEVDTSGLATSEELKEHTDNTTVHTTEAEKTAWNNKSNFSGNYSDLSGAPNISTDEEDDELIICDSNGNVIMRVNANGLNAAAVYVNGKQITFPDYSEATDGSVLKIVDGTPAWVAES